MAGGDLPLPYLSEVLAPEDEGGCLGSVFIVRTPASSKKGEYCEDGERDERDTVSKFSSEDTPVD